MKNQINLNIELNQAQLDSLIKEGSCIYQKDHLFIQIERLPVFEDETVK